MLHELKILPENFNDITAGKKYFEIRKNDRDYMAGDTLALNEWTGDAYTGRFHLVNINKVYDYPDYLQEGYVILQLTKFEGYAITSVFQNPNRRNKEAHKDD